jgi:hypothetical protein
MSVLALASVKASPGVTTSLLALAATWPADRPLLLVEADPDGGDLAARAGLPPEPGLTSLAAAGRRALADGELDRHVQSLPGGLPVIVGPADCDHATRALGMVGERLASGLAGLHDRDVLVDCGRLRPASPATSIVAGADVVVLVARPRLDELQHLRPALPRLAAAGARPVLLLIGERPYPPGEVAEVLAVPVLSLPDDRDTAGRLNGQGGRTERLARSLLLRTARGVAQTLADTLTHPAESVREPSVSGPGGPSRPAGPSRERSVSGEVHGERSGWAAALTRSPSDDGERD